MDDAFDPYHKWLGIPPDEQPPNHYRLLGVAALEADLDVISHASDQRMAHIRTFQGGKHGALSQRVLNEIAAAKVCLLSPAKKQQYDQMLLEQRAALARSLMPPSPPPNMPPVGYAPARPIARAPLPVAAPVEHTPELFADESIQSYSRGRTRRRKTSWLAPIIFMLFVIAGLGLAVAIVVHNQKAVAPVPAKNSGAKTVPAKANLPVQASDPNRVRKAGENDPPQVVEPVQPPREPAVEPKTAPAPPSAIETLLARAHAAVEAGNVVETDTVGVEQGTSFEQIAARGGLLMGVKVSLGTIDSQQRVTSVQPIFWTQKGPQFGAVHGQQTAQVSELRAGPGLLVGGINASGTEYVAGLELVLMPVGKQGLDTKRATKTKWVGARDQAPPVELGGKGHAVVGLFGSVDQSLTRLGLITEAYHEGEMTVPPVPVAEEDVPTMPGDEPAPAFAEKPEEAKLPAPSGAPLKKARESVRELFRQEFADAKTPAQKFALAEKLFKQAKATSDDPAAQYVLLDEARQLAVQVGDSEAALQAIMGLANQFKIDDVGLTVASLTEAERAPALGPIKKKLSENALRLVDKAVERERFDVAERLAGVALRAANKAADSMLIEQAKNRTSTLRPQAKAFAAVQEALKTLETMPEDADANLAVGRYRCLVRDDWSTGLPLLAKGSNTGLKEVTEIELAPPTDGAELAHLGDLWVALAQSEPAIRVACQKRARLWYKRAMPQLTGLARTKVEKAIEELSGGHGLKAEFFAGAGNFANKLKTRIDPNIDFQWGQRDPDEDVNTPKFTVRWSGWISAPAKGTYKLVLDHDNGGRILIDGKLAIDNWENTGRSELTLPLTRKAKPISIEYFNDGGQARAILRWSQVGGFAEQVVPTEALFHNITAAQKGFGQEP